MRYNHTSWDEDLNQSIFWYNIITKMNTCEGLKNELTYEKYGLSTCLRNTTILDKNIDVTVKKRHGKTMVGGKKNLHRRIRARNIYGWKYLKRRR